MLSIQVEKSENEKIQDVVKNWYNEVPKIESKREWRGRRQTPEQQI
jgi:hypothetical protein